MREENFLHVNVAFLVTLSHMLSLSVSPSHRLTRVGGRIYRMWRLGDVAEVLHSFHHFNIHIHIYPYAHHHHPITITSQNQTSPSPSSPTSLAHAHPASAR